MNLTLKQIEAFVQVARLGSFTKAAEALHLTQSTISLLVRDLENGLQARLLDRSTRVVVLTDVGREFFAGAERILGDLSHVVSNVGELLAKRRGRVVLTAPLVLSSTLVSRIIAVFRVRYPDIELVLKDCLPDQVLPNILASAADIGIGTFTSTPERVHSDLLFKEPLVAIFPDGHPFSAQRQLKWKDLEGASLLTLPRGNVFRAIADTGLRAANVNIESTFEAFYVGTLIGLVQAGLGVAIAPGSATILADHSRIGWRRLEEPVVERDVLLIHRGTSALSPAAEALIDTIRQESSHFASTDFGVSPSSWR